MNHVIMGSKTEAVQGEKRLPWTIRNKRYAIPESFIARHPGGAESILLGEGRNCTELFESYHSLSTEKPWAMLKQWYIEDAQKGDPDYEDAFDWEADKTPFYTELKAAVRNYFLERGISHKATWTKMGIVLGFVLLTALVYVFGYLKGHWWAPLLLPWCYWLGPACLLHDGTHFALSKFPWVNKVLSRLGSFHMGSWAWYHQHVIGHHGFTNVLDKDPDLRAFEGEAPESIYGHRLSPFAEYFPMYRRWLKSLLITMPFSCLQPSIKQDTNVWIHKSYDSTVPVTHEPPAWRTLLHMMTRVVMWGFLFVVPFFLFSPLKAMFFSFYPSLGYGVQYYVFSQISHINEECFHPIISRDWAVHQIQTSLDWGVYHPFWKYLSIALNLQTIHHLFPQVDSSHHMQLRPIIQRLAKKYNIKLNYAPTLWDALVVHFKHIYAINRGGVNDNIRASK